MMSLTEVEQFARTNWHLPGFGQHADNGLFGGSDKLLASLGAAYIHLFDIDARLRKLEKTQ